MNWQTILFYAYLTINSIILLVYMVLFIHKAFNRFYYRRRFEDRIEEYISSIRLDVNELKRKFDSKKKPEDYLDSRQSMD